MDKKINKILAELKEALKDIKQRDIESLEHRFLGRKSELNEILHSIGALKPDEKKKIGAMANKARAEIVDLIKNKKNSFYKTTTSNIDVTAPGRLYEVGHVHPVNQVLNDLLETFKSLGYEIVTGPEVEDDWHNFEALNMPKDHPARDMQDTFYLTDGNVLRTHTSPVQIRYMENNKPPIKIVSPGKAFRNENEDASHSWSFTQVEGLVVDKNITLSDLKGTLEVLVKSILGSKTKTRFRPSFFPYTEPSAEIDASCPHCDGKGCRSCGYTGWIELLGSGMVHPEVLRKMGVDPLVYSGFAFGMGPERLTAIKYQIPDVRFFGHPDIRFLEQF
jgi:phenylalanyl-tRNA synthetase alpha chain